jgi:xanthine dehydrogenase accessory factor
LVFLGVLGGSENFYMKTIFKAIVEIEERNETAALCTIVRSQGSTPRHTTSKMLVYPDGRILGTVGGGEVESRVRTEALQVIAEGRPRLLAYNMADPARGDPGVCGGQLEIFVEPILPKPVLLLIGAGHVGKAVVHLAKWLGFYVIVSDDRPEFCTPNAVPGADEYQAVSMSALPDKVKFSPWTYIVLTTRGMNVDVDGLPPLLHEPYAYLGIIGSQRRWALARKALAEVGISEEVLKGIHSPIGLEIEAETPEEIAVSILGEIIALRNRKPPEVPG